MQLVWKLCWNGWSSFSFGLRWCLTKSEFWMKAFWIKKNSFNLGLMKLIIRFCMFSGFESTEDYLLKTGHCGFKCMASIVKWNGQHKEHILRWHGREILIDRLMVVKVLCLTGQFCYNTVTNDPFVAVWSWMLANEEMTRKQKYMSYDSVQ